MATPVSLDRYAEIQAELGAGQLRDEVLARAGVSAEEWTAAQRGWLDRMGSELAVGCFELTNRYAQAFLARQRALIAPPAALPVASLAAPVPSAQKTEGVASPAEVLPSYLMPAAPSQTVQPATAAPVAPADNPLTATMTVDISALRAALPFIGPTGAPSSTTNAAPPAPAPPVRRAPAELSGTAIGRVMPKSAPLPFAPDAVASSRAGIPAQVDSPPAVAPAVNRAPAELSGTTMAFVIPKGPALPFTAGGGGAPATCEPAILAPPTDDDSRETLPMPMTDQEQLPPNDAPVSTAVLPTDDAATAPLPPFAAPKPALPFPAAAGRAPSAPGAGAPPTLTLEQYAALCAELAVYPLQQEAVFQRYGLGAQRDRAAVDSGWRQRLQASPGEYQRWQALYQQHHARLSGLARGGR